jgi:hypothetical protein
VLTACNHASYRPLSADFGLLNWTHNGPTIGPTRKLAFASRTQQHQIMSTNKIPDPLPAAAQ